MPLDWVPARDEVVHYGSGLAVVVRVMIHHVPSLVGQDSAFAEIREIVEKPPRRRARRRTPEERVADVIMGKEKETDATPRVRIVPVLDLSPLLHHGGGS